MPQELCTVSVGRTGSTLLTVLLRNNSNVLSLSEVFAPEYASHHDLTDGPLRQWRARIAPIAEFHSWRQYLEQYRSIADETGAALLHYKIVIDGNQRGFVLRLHEFLQASSSVSFIVLRRNPLDTFISLQKARTTGSFADVDYSRVKVDFDPESLMLHLFYQRSVEAFTQDLLRRLGTRFATIWYEELASLDLASQLAHLNRVLRHRLGIHLEVEELAHNIVRQNNVPSVRDNFTNPGAFDQFLQRYGSCIGL